MLVLTRKTGEDILIGDDIEIVITRIDPGAVRIAIHAPQNVVILRGELMREQEVAAAKAALKAEE